jgi:uncharacterized protein
MHTLAWDEIDDILVGATIMGCGGGGELAEGRELMRRAYDEGRAVALATPDELPDETLVVCPYGVGGLTVGDEADYAGRSWSVEHPGVLAVRALGEHLGREFGALITGELGGTSIADAFYPAAMLGLPVIDADPVGRAVPELGHSMFNLHGVPIVPQAVVNELGDTAIITAVADDGRAEALVRALAVASRNLVWVADHALPWGRMKEVVILGAISLAKDVGRAFRRSVAAGEDPAAAAAVAGGGGVLFRGRVTAFSWEDKDGFTWGEVEIAGHDTDAGVAYRIWFKNENLMAWRDGAPDATAPDLICCFAAETGQPITNPNHEVGRSVTVVGLPAAAPWGTERGVTVFGPRSFGYDVDYIPLAKRLSAG